jgi:uncharacterized protein YjiS (DUF1127 family)
MSIAEFRPGSAVLGRHVRTEGENRPWVIGLRAIDSLVELLLEWHERLCQRRQLLALNDHALKDFGRSRCDAVREADKPFLARLSTRQTTIIQLLPLLEAARTRGAARAKWW